MRLKQTFALLWAMATVTGCRSRYVVPEQPMPPNTILLSQMMRELSAEPGSTEKFLQQLGGAKRSPGKRGPALMTPALIDDLRKRMLGKDWQGLDRFPGWTMREIDPTVRLADRVVGKDSKLEGMSAVHPGSPATSPSEQQARSFLDLGPYSLNEAQTISLNKPSTLPGFTTEGLVTSITPAITRGDGPNDLAPEHAESQRLADVLNRLAVNRLDSARPFSVAFNLTTDSRVSDHALYDSHRVGSVKGTVNVTTPESLIYALINTGHTVTVTDTRYFANFGHLHYKGKDVMMPFWVNTRIDVPQTASLFHRPRALLIPVSHAEIEWHIRGPRINADVSHYFGVDGKAEWRTMDTLDQAWVLKRDAHTYTGGQAVEVTRLAGLITLAYMHQHARRPTLAFGGYYALGVCQDPVSAVEKKLNGRSTLFPNTADGALFDDPRDAEVNALIGAIPKDRDGSEPQAERIFGSLPTTPGEDNNFAAIAIPGLAQDLRATYAAWQQNKLEHTHSRFAYYAAYGGVAVALVVLVALFATSLQRRQQHRL